MFVAQSALRTIPPVVQPELLERPGRRAARDWSEIVGLLSAIGSGKTTLIKLILGLQLPSSGHVHLFDEMLSLQQHRRIGYVPQNLELWDMIHRQAEEGTAVLVSTHYMDESEQADRPVIMSHGVVVASGTSRPSDSDLSRHIVKAVITEVQGVEQ